MTFEIDNEAGVAIVRLHGELTGENADEFIAAVANLLTGPRSQIVLDLADVPFVNSTGLGHLVRLAAQANTQESRLVLASLAPLVQGVLATTQLDRFFETCATTPDAVARLTSPP